MVETGCEAESARTLNAPYLKRLITGMPYVTAKWAMTLDGKTAAASGDSRWISSEASRGLVHELRGRMDAIVVGIGTVEADDPLLTARPPGPRSRPDRAGQRGAAAGFEPPGPDGARGPGPRRGHRASRAQRPRPARPARL